MEPRSKHHHHHTGLAAPSAVAARVAILARCGIVPGSSLPSAAGKRNYPELRTASQCYALRMEKRSDSGSRAARIGDDTLCWAASASVNYSGRWFFAQAPEPDDEAQDEPEDEKQDEAEPQRKPAPAVRKQSSTEDNAGLLRDGGTINPPFP